MITEQSKTLRCMMLKEDKSLDLEAIATSVLQKIFQELRIFIGDKFLLHQKKQLLNCVNQLINNILEMDKQMMMNYLHSKN